MEHGMDGSVHKGKIMVVLNKAELNAKAYRDFLDKVRPLLNKYSSGGHQGNWNFGYSYVDYNGYDADSGIWTYPGFSAFQDFDSEKKSVSFVFFSSYDSHCSRGKPPDSIILDVSSIFSEFLKFAEEVAETTGYNIVVHKPYWLQLKEEDIALF
ncbi:MAG: hypothetical protein UV62_C0007G0027 [Parcubacteria group bacterium GW2011_GWC1_43_11]|nr:MAG: hypothetical protein UV62_C0007G0027 [Parcubacteria group bacterium GW2011_GWC1_43_11]